MAARAPALSADWSRHASHSAKFLVAFYNYERALLFSRSFCKLIIRLVKFVISNYSLYLADISRLLFLCFCWTIQLR